MGMERALLTPWSRATQFVPETPLSMNTEHSALPSRPPCSLRVWCLQVRRRAEEEAEEDAEERGGPAAWGEVGPEKEPESASGAARRRVR